MQRRRDAEDERTHSLNWRCNKCAVLVVLVGVEEEEEEKKKKKENATMKMQKKMAKMMPWILYA